MPIKFNKNTKEFHLYNNEISYIINILKNNQIGNLYFGKKITHRDSFKHLLNINNRALTACIYKDDYSFSLDHIKQEYPSYGTTDFRQPSHKIKQRNGSTITNFEYKKHYIYKGKKKLDGLPATYTENENEAITLEIHLEDSIIRTELVLYYSIFENYSAIARSAKFINKGESDIKLCSAMSMSLDLPDDEYEMMHLSGGWSRERHVKKRKLQSGIQSVYSARGASSVHHNPFIALKKFDANEFNGEVYGFSLVYSGNFIAQVEVDYLSVSRITMGINPFGFEWSLEKGKEFQTPEAVMVYSLRGINGMSQTYHKLYRTRLARGYWRDKTRPILINNWEATYFDFNEEKILNIAKTAKEYGVEMFVLDDGWFGKRNDDTTSLGDWFVDESKLPNGISSLANKIKDMGMMFGLWFEPEMVNKASKLYEEHPDWVISTPNRKDSHGRNQFVLDFSRKEVVDYIFAMMDNILSEAPVSYIKWDMNRNITEAYSIALDTHKQEELMHRHILGVYNLYERLIEKFPKILFESCASGGGRFDPGMLYYAPQTWTSDDTDAIERLKIQYGTSMVYPISSMGSHVSAVPNHQVLRVTDIDTRANVAYFGTFGYELDLNHLSIEDKNKLRNQIDFYKENRELIQKGDFYRLISPFEKDGNITSWMVVSEDKEQSLVGYYKILNEANPVLQRIKLQGLDNEKKYSINNSDKLFYGDELMNIGILPGEIFTGYNDGCKHKWIKDFYSTIFILKAV
ncbi:alpha-galactosidase [Clostridium sediminicola]|uniref:alpha-galactosidase n=1 Tax=Clostridium sediminicola TaxID=3114879 RepID=UPI0031F262BA